ncbi:TraR/DksA C4-type zinc finger protein [Streptomyces sp. NPDC047000]|uniref:TraR/DksA family transcriptional regulator n=1 Tax=Streptomyces sp. NPDC047000 TaxID=3155474 RepID=UPI0033F30BF5
MSHLDAPHSPPSGTGPALRSPSAVRDTRARLEHARSTRLIQLRALAETGDSAADHLAGLRRSAIEDVLTAVDEAFARVDDGTYGTCRNCAEPIPAERLEILPYTPHCVTCRRAAH